MYRGGRFSEGYAMSRVEMRWGKRGRQVGIGNGAER